MSNKRLSRELVKSVGVGLGAIGLLGGMAVAGGVLLEKMEQQVAEGLQQASFPTTRPTMIGRAEPIQDIEHSTGPTAGDYVFPGGVLIADIGVAAYALWRFRDKKQTPAAPPAAGSFRLTIQEEQAFEMIVSQFDQDN